MENPNPWSKLSENPYVLEIDRECIRRHNELVRDEATKFIIGSIPEPYIGSPKTAKVVLLGKNPGHSDDDKKSYCDRDFQSAMFHNLLHEPQEYPFYPLNPAFSWTGAGKWWRKHTRELQIDCGMKYEATLGKRLLVIEWFPYHSERFARPRTVCGSQQYSFDLARQMLEKDLLIIGMRGRREWMEVDKRFGEIPFLNSPQNVCISRGNTKGDLYERIVKALKEDG
jgi:hypothetical protein